MPTRLSAIGISLFLFLGCNAPPPTGSSSDAETSGANESASADPDSNTSTPDESASDDAAAPFVMFDDPDSDFSTSEVRDIDEEIVRFDVATMTLIWAADDREFDVWVIRDNFLGDSQSFQVRFGTKDGERRAYFTETGSATICDFVVDDGDFSIRSTPTTVAEHTGQE